MCKFADTDEYKLFRSDSYNYNFHKPSGLFQRWGKTQEDNPQFAPAPEILDIEVSVNGCPNACPFCYKGNSNDTPTNMTFETFKTIIDKFPKLLTQVAFGITGVKTNPDFVKMLAYTRSLGIIPNFTLSGIDLDDALADEICKYIGAVAVSIYPHNPDIGYDTVKKFTDRGVKQTNVHLMVSEETYEHVRNVLVARALDSRMTKVNAIVFLGVKPKGRGTDYHPLSKDKFKSIVEWCVKEQIGFGFDSCSAHKFSSILGDLGGLSAEQKGAIGTLVEPCESSCFSSYINVKGEYWNCSFCENHPDVKPVNVLEVKDFIREVWYAPQVVAFRKKVLFNRHRACPMYEI